MVNNNHILGTLYANKTTKLNQTVSLFDSHERLQFYHDQTNQSNIVSSQGSALKLGWALMKLCIKILVANCFYWFV